MRIAEARLFDEKAICFEGETLGVRDEEVGALHPLPQSSTLATTTWPRQTSRRAPGDRIGAPEGPARGSGIALHLFSLRTTPERQRIEAPEALVGGDTRFCSTRLSL